MTEQHSFDRAYWEQRWAGGLGSMSQHPPNPYLSRELSNLTPGTALDAGCGAGAEATWLATNGWQVTAADISPEALTHAADRAAAAGVSKSVQLVEADLSTWEPESQYDLVTTHYAHPAIPQLDFYSRLAGWVAPGGTLLIVGHLHTHTSGHDHHPPAEASATAGAITARLNPAEWEVVTAEEQQRTLSGVRKMTLHVVIVRATRRA